MAIKITDSDGKTVLVSGGGGAPNVSVNGISPDAEGNIILTPPIIGAAGNPNLLDNWYFADPINQRGNTEYTTYGYSFDRWLFTGLGSFSRSSDGVILVPNSTDGVWIRQPFENPADFKGKKITLSVLITAVTSVNFAVGISDYDIVGADWGGTNLISKSVNPGETALIVCTSTSLTLGCNLVNLQVIGNGQVVLHAAKMELGDQQTLAHQDSSGNWVLNDPPPNKALELLKCQRYYQGFSYTPRVPCYVNGYLTGFNFLTTMIAVPAVTLRAKHMNEGQYKSVDYVVSDRTGVSAISVPGSVKDEWYMLDKIVCNAEL